LYGIKQLGTSQKKTAWCFYKACKQISFMYCKAEAVKQLNEGKTQGRYGV